MRARALIAALALLGAIGSAALASGTSRRVVGNCLKSQVRPRTITVACADGNLVLAHVRWSSFGGSRAHASATYYVNDCKPYCAAGKFHSYPITLALSNAKTCPDGKDDYRLVTVSFTGQRPPGLGTSAAFPLFCSLKG